MAEGPRRGLDREGRLRRAACTLMMVLAMLAGASPLHAASIVRRPVGEALRTDSRWFFWPFVETGSGPGGRYVDVHPFYSWHGDAETGGDSSHALWPLVIRTHRPDAWGTKDRRTLDIVPLWHSSTGDQGERGRVGHRYLVPFYWAGKQSGTEDRPGGRYLIVFPFLWHAENARLVAPLFPTRPQNFSAFFPFGGTFDGYWNRDRVRFFLWPLLVESTKRTPDETVKLYSFPWPFVGLYSAEKTTGFRLWPLFSRVHKPGEFTRAYWLWPLGHYRREASAETGRSPRELALFLPFYGRARDGKYEYDLAFPFYGELRQKGRHTRGYALAIYNEDDDLRKGLRSHRLLWFLVRWTSRIPATVEPRVEPTPEDVASSPGPMEGGGVFPVYLKRTNSRSVRQTIAWPFYNRRIDRYDDRTYRREFLLPFYGRAETRHSDGKNRGGWFLWPLKRSIVHRDGTTFSSVPHLFPYMSAEPVDLNWAPLWMAWTRSADPATGEVRTRLLGNFSAFDRQADGTVTRQLNAAVWSWRGSKAPDGSRSGRSNILFGLASRHWAGGKAEWRLAGKRP